MAHLINLCPLVFRHLLSYHFCGQFLAREITTSELVKIAYKVYLHFVHLSLILWQLPSPLLSIHPSLLATPTSYPGPSLLHRASKESESVGEVTNSQRLQPPHSFSIITLASFHSSGGLSSCSSWTEGEHREGVREEEEEKGREGERQRVINMLE